MTRQTMGTIMLSAMVKRRARGERQAEEINWRKMLRIRKWKVLARSLLATHNVVRHTYEFRRKIKFYPNLFIYGTYNSQLTTHRFTSAHFSHILEASEDETEVNGRSEANHPQSYLFNKRNGTRKHKFAFYVDKSFSLRFLARD